MTTHAKSLALGALSAAALLCAPGLASDSRPPAKAMSAEETCDAIGLGERSVRDIFSEALLNYQIKGYFGVLLTSVKMLPGPSQESLLRGLFKLAKAALATPDFRGQYARGREETFGLKPGEEDEGVPRRPEDMLKARLRSFLKDSDGVDFRAEVSLRGGKAVFVDPGHESKPSVWKMCFRAGPRLTAAARDSAAAWLAELESSPAGREPSGD